MIAIAAIAALGGATIGFFHYRSANRADPATIRDNIATSGKAACFTSARADGRNALLADAKLTAFCDCTMDRMAASMTDDDVREAAAHASVVGEGARLKLAAANAACRSRLVE